MNITERVDKLTHIPPEYLKSLVPLPKSVKLELTNNCDLGCKFCACSNKDRKTGNMDWELFIKITHELKSIGLEELGLFYLGESFLYNVEGEWALPQAIDYVKNVLKFKQVFLTTNGVSANEDKLRQVISKGLDSLKFSFNYANKQQAIDISQRDIYDKLISNIKLARKIRDEVYQDTGHYCGLYASSIKYNSDQIELMSEAINEIKESIDQHYWIPFCNQGGNKTEIQTEVSGNIGRLDNPVSPLPCWSLFTGAHITYTGNVTICCFDHSDRFSMGNIKEQSFMDIWNSPRLCDLRRRHLNKDVSNTICERCING